VQENDEGGKAGEEITAFSIVRIIGAYANTASAACRRFRCRSAITCAPANLKRGRNGYRTRRQTGIDAKGLEATRRTFNKTAADGQDPAFGKGSRAYNRYPGRRLHGPNPCIAPIKDGPFYASKW